MLRTRLRRAFSSPASNCNKENSPKPKKSLQDDAGVNLLTALRDSTNIEKPAKPSISTHSLSIDPEKHESEHIPEHSFIAAELKGATLDFINLLESNLLKVNIVNTAGDMNFLLTEQKMLLNSEQEIKSFINLFLLASSKFHHKPCIQEILTSKNFIELFDKYCTENIEELMSNYQNHPELLFKFIFGDTNDPRAFEKKTLERTLKLIQIISVKYFLARQENKEALLERLNLIKTKQFDDADTQNLSLELVAKIEGQYFPSSQKNRKAINNN